jgi:hypothetical protein
VRITLIGEHPRAAGHLRQADEPDVGEAEAGGGDAGAGHVCGGKAELAHQGGADAIEHSGGDDQLVAGQEVPESS